MADVQDRLWEMENKFFLNYYIAHENQLPGTKMYGFLLIYFLINSYFNQFSTIFFDKIISF